MRMIVTAVAAGAALLIAANFAPVQGWVIPDDENFRDSLSIQVLLNAVTLYTVMLFYALTALRRAELELQDQLADHPLFRGRRQRAVDRELTGAQTRMLARWRGQLHAV